jgi:hypothetical protein
MTEQNYEYEGYEKALERILAISEKDYWTQYVDINRHQVNVAKTYLWVSAALLGAYSAIISKYGNYLIDTPCAILLAAFGGISAILAFGICLYAIPARTGYRAIPEKSWGEFTAASSEFLKKKEKNIYIKLLTDLNNKIDKANHHNLSTNRKRALLLRKTSWVLIASFVFALLAGTTSSLSVLINSENLEKETVMTEENEPTNQAPETPPDVPEPAGPISGGSSDISTHSADIGNSKINIRITEGKQGNSGEDE